MRIKAIVNRSDERQKHYINYLEEKWPSLFTEENPEMFFVVGGDGAMLHAHKNNQFSNIPFFGKGLGTLNFIMNNFSNDDEIISGLLNGDISPKIFNTPKIKASVKIHSIDQDIAIAAINDIVIGGNIMDWNTFELTSKMGSFDHYKMQGAGICIATPLGSTAFSLNNNGTMLPIDSSLWCVTSVVSSCNINELMKPQWIKIKVKSTRCRPSIFIDGTTTSIELNYGDEIFIEKTEDTFQLALLDSHDFFNKRTQLLQKKR